MREFTWWRRFHGAFKLSNKNLYKGASELLQRIEFGEYEFNNLGREYYLEDVIFNQKVEKIKKDSPWLVDASLEDRLEYDRKQHNKRKSIIMKNHLEAEEKMLFKLANDLSKEFNLNLEDVKNLMETFDGTTRELYFKCMSIANNKKIDPTKMQRFFNEQPRHILKPKERKYAKLWIDLVKEKQWQNYLNWDQLK